MQEKTITPYELPDVKNHSFFFVDARINPDIEAKLHRHDAWELYYVIQGCGQRMTGDTLQPFSAGDVALIPPSMLHRWEFAPDSTDKDGHIRYLMVAFSHTFVERCMETFPEMRNSLDGIEFPVNALNFGPGKLPHHPPNAYTDEWNERIGTPLRNAPTAFCCIHFVRHDLCRQAHTHRTRRKAHAAYLHLRNAPLHPHDLLKRHRRRSVHEPLGILLLFQTLQRHNLSGIFDRIPHRHGMRDAQDHTAVNRRDLLCRRIQRHSEFQPPFQKGKTIVSESVQSTILRTCLQ